MYGCKVITTVTAATEFLLAALWHYNLLEMSFFIRCLGLDKLCIVVVVFERKMCSYAVFNAVFSVYTFQCNSLSLLVTPIEL